MSKQDSFKGCIQDKKLKNPDNQPFDLKDFNIGLQIGSGAFAVVKRAVHKTSLYKVAIKTYEKKNLIDNATKEAVQKEINILSRLDHPNVMGLYEVVDNRLNVNLIMELCNGKSLFHYIKKKPSQKLAEQECKGIFKQVVHAVAYLHDEGVVHRDLKLDNILIDDNKIIKLIDFGFSVNASAETKLKLFCGTPHYMDPDIVKKKEYNG